MSKTSPANDNLDLRCKYSPESRGTVDSSTAIEAVSAPGDNSLALKVNLSFL